MPIEQAGESHGPVPFEGRPPADLRRATVLIGWVATAASISMYVAYIDQIARNLDGTKGSALQPLAAFVAASLWTAYGACRARWDWPLIAANVPGIILAAIAFATAL